MISQTAPRLAYIQKNRQEILRISEKRGGRNVRVFGSVSRGTDTVNSDVDFLMNFEADTTLFDRSGLMIDLQELLGCPVDVVSEKSLHPLIRNEVLSSAVPL